MRSVTITITTAVVFIFLAMRVSSADTSLHRNESHRRLMKTFRKPHPKNQAHQREQRKMFKLEQEMHAIFADQEKHKHKEAMVEFEVSFAKLMRTDKLWQAARENIHNACDQLKSHIQQSNVYGAIGVEFQLLNALGVIWALVNLREPEFQYVTDRFGKEENFTSIRQTLITMYRKQGYIRTAQNVWEAWHFGNAYDADTLNKVTAETWAEWFQGVEAAMRCPTDPLLTSATPTVATPSSLGRSASASVSGENICGASGCSRPCAKHELCKKCFKAKHRRSKKRKGRRGKK